MEGFTSLEQEVLEAICKAWPDAALRDLIDTARVTARDNTGHGFFTYFEVNRSRPPLDHPSRAISGPNALMRDLGDDNHMGFVLFVEDGYPDCLEGFQHGDRTGRTVDLRRHDLHGLRAQRIEAPGAPDSPVTPSGD